jgi:hypothetical protein
MNTESKSRPQGRGNRDSVADSNASSPQKTPSADMQPEDAGTAESGNTGSGPAAESAMKQTSKTGTERGVKRRAAG